MQRNVLKRTKKIKGWNTGLKRVSLNMQAPLNLAVEVIADLNVIRGFQKQIGKSLMDSGKQRIFIARYAMQTSTKQRMSSKPKCPVSYMSPSNASAINVCKTFFLDTLAVSDSYISNTYKKTNEMYWNC